MGGGQVGINYQFWGGVVIGAEADFDWLPNTNTAISTLANPPGMTTGSTATLTINNRWLTSVTGRVGYAFDRVLFYGKGGGAWVGSDNPTVAVGGAPVTIATSNSNWGWTGGLGVEWAFWGNWSARFEYDFVGLNSQAFAIPASVGGLPASDQFSLATETFRWGTSDSITNSAAGDHKRRCAKTGACLGAAPVLTQPQSPRTETSPIETSCSPQLRAPEHSNECIRMKSLCVAATAISSNYIDFFEERDPSATVQARRA